MKFNAKDITNEIYTTFKQDGVFESNFIDESKFKARLYRLISTSDVLNGNVMEVATGTIDIAYQLTKDIVKENVDNTLSDLIDKGLVKEVINDDGEIAYIATNE